MLSAPIPAAAGSSRTVVIMQPYLFPYVGYFQLLAAADCFVVYDDVNFIRRGWVNRNRLLAQGQPQFFTVPLDAASQNRKICDIALSTQLAWRPKLLQTIAQSYRRALHYEPAYALLERVLMDPEAVTIADLVRRSLTEIKTYLELPAQLVPSSKVYNNGHLSAQARILDICRQEQATDYVNAQGGRELYDLPSFENLGMRLHFLQPELCPYPQLGKQEFVPGLSIIDVLMNNSVAETNELLRAYSLEP